MMVERTSRTIACKAKKVGETHTPDVAFLTIPLDCPHGKVLLCNHAPCRLSGRIFRYCKYCNKVCANRNFSARHGNASCAYKAAKSRCPAEMVINRDDVDSGGDSRTREDDASTITTNTTRLVPSFRQSTVFTSEETPLNPSMLMMEVSRNEANLIRWIRSTWRGGQYSSPVVVRGDSIIGRISR